MVAPVSAWLQRMTELSRQPTAHIERRGTGFVVARRKELWNEVGPLLTDQQLVQVERLAVTVLQSRVEPVRAHSAQPREGASRTFSPEMRRGLAETLALLGSASHVLTSCSPGVAEATAARVVTRLLSNSERPLWIPLGELLPILAEAAPGPFIDAVEVALASKPSPLAALFDEGSSELTVGATTGLLPALECLAWDADFLGRSILTLGALAASDTAGSWGRRPRNSAVSVLLPWHPQTRAGIPKRKAAMLALLREQPGVGWDVLLALLPQSRAFASDTHRPRWRQMVSSDEQTTASAYWEQIGIYLGLAIDEAGRSSARTADLVDHIPHMTPDLRTRFLEHVVSEKVLGLAEHERCLIWEALLRVAVKHRSFSDADWAMKAEVVSELEKVALILQPESVLMRYQRLFDGKRGNVIEWRGDYGEQQRMLKERRRAGVLDVLNVLGVDGVMDMAKTVRSPRLLGETLGGVDSKTLEERLLPDGLASGQSHIAELVLGFVFGRVEALGLDWVESIGMRLWTQEERGALLRLLPLGRRVWALVEELLDDVGLYWDSVVVEPYQIDAADLELTARHLLGHRRPASAIQCLELLVRGERKSESNTVSRDVVIEALRTPGAASVLELDPRSARALVVWLQSDPEVSLEDMWEIEWRYIPILDAFNGASARLLGRRLAADPDYFCEIVRKVYRSKVVVEMEPLGATDAIESGLPTAAEVEDAEKAYQLLREWRLPPGCVEGSLELDVSALKTWVRRAMDSAASTGHVEVAMDHLGEVLTYGPPERALGASRNCRCSRFARGNAVALGFHA